MKTTLWIVGIIIVALLGYYFWYLPGHSAENDSTKGTIVFSFTDQTTDIQDVNEVHMEVDKVQLYSQTKGWVEVSSKDVDYKLLALKASGQSQVYVSAQVPVDTYTATRVTVKKVTVDTQSKGQKTAIMPKNEIDIAGSIRVQNAAADEGKTTSVHIDVLAAQSLHLASNGSDYVFTPVIKTEIRSNATVNSSLGGVVTITDGTVDTNTTSGMDVDGTMKANFRIEANVGINVSGGAIQLPASTSTSPTGTLKTNTGGTVNGAVNGTVNGVINY